MSSVLTQIVQTNSSEIDTQHNFPSRRNKKKNKISTENFHFIRIAEF